MATKIVSVQDGPRTTVSDLIKAPTLIPERVLHLMLNMFLADFILRPAGSVPSGVLIYRESEPLFADGDAEVVEEFGEIPLITTSRGVRKVAKTVKRALGILVSQEMLDREAMDEVNKQITKVTNTMIRTWNKVFLDLFLTNPGIATMAVAAPWTGTSSKVRKDLALGKVAVSNADTDTSNGTGESKLGFEPDTLIVNIATAATFEYSDDINKPYVGNIADESPQYRGTLPREFAGLRIMKSFQVPANKAILLQRGIVGGIADERALHGTPLTLQSDNTETYRSNIIRRSAMFVDQPQAAIVLTGVES